MKTPQYQPKNILTLLLFLYGLMFLLWGLLNDRFLSSLLDNTTPVRFTLAQSLLLMFSALSFFAACQIKYRKWKNSFLQSKRLINSLLVVLSFVFPIVLLEIVLTPFTHIQEKEISIFVKDDTLSWRQRN